MDHEEGGDGGGRRAILIVGMHRSGTSAMAGMLCKLWGIAPETLMLPQADNPRGFWESAPIAQFNESLLAAAGRRWDDPKPVAADWFRSQKREGDKGKARDLLQQEFAGSRRFVMKDPRISRLLPFWRDVLHLENIQPHVIIAVRNPLDVAASLEARDALGTALSLQLWLAYVMAAEKDTRGLKRAVLHYEDVLADWRTALARVSADLDVEVPPLAGETADAIDDYLTDEERHHGSGIGDLLRHAEVPRLAKELYADLLLDRGQGQLDRRLWDRAHEQLTLAWDLLSPGPGGSRERSGEGPGPVKPRLRSAASGIRRPVILHYRLFQSGGEGLDQVLRRNFPGGVKDVEGGTAVWEGPGIDAYLGEHPATVVLSSQTARLSVPDADTLHIHPLVFIRHPLERARLVYELERLQAGDAEEVLRARACDLKGYIEWRLSRKADRTIRDFQVCRLADAVLDAKGERERAFAALEALPFIGVAELASESLKRVEDRLKPAFPSFSLDASDLAGGDDLRQLPGRLLALREALGETLYARLEDANQGDVELHRRAVAKIGTSGAAIVQSDR